MTLQVKPKNMDKYRWLALLAGTLLLGTCSWAMTWSLMVDPMIELRGASVQSMATVYTLLTVTSAIFTILGGKLVDKWGSSKVLLTGIIAFAIAQAICYVSSSFMAFAIANVLFCAWQQSVVYIGVMNTVEHMFPDFRGLAVSVAATGISMVGMVLAPMTQRAIDVFGFQSMFLVTGGVLTVIGLVTLFLFPNVSADYAPKNMKPGADEEEIPGNLKLNPNFVQKDWKAMLKDPAFYLLFLMPLGGSSGYMLLSYQLAYIAQDILNISAMEASFLVSGVSLMGIITLVTGPIGDKIGRMKVASVLLLFGTISISGLIVSESHDIIWFAVCAFVYAFCLGGFAGLHPAIVGDIFGSDNFGFNYSICYMSVLLAAAISPWLAVIGNSGENASYSTTFIVCAVLCGAAFIISLILLKLKGKNTEYIITK